MTPQEEDLLKQAGETMRRVTGILPEVIRHNWDQERGPAKAPASRYAVEPIARYGIVKGWKIVAPDGRSLMGFTTRREAEVIVDFFNGK